MLSLSPALGALLPSLESPRQRRKQSHFHGTRYKFQLFRKAMWRKRVVLLRTTGLQVPNPQGSRVGLRCLQLSLLGVGYLMDPSLWTRLNCKHFERAAPHAHCGR